MELTEKRGKAETDILVTVATGLFATHTRDTKRSPAYSTQPSGMSIDGRNAKNGWRSCRPSTTRASGTSESNPNGVKREKAVR